MRPWPRSVLALAAFVPLALAACSPDEPGDGGAGAGGGTSVDPLHALTVHPAQFIGENMPLRLLDEGGPFDLWNATQGGHVARVAAQIDGIGGDTINMRARFTIVDTGEIVAEEARTVVVEPVPGSDTLKQNKTALSSQMTHVPLCPDYQDYDIIDRPLLLTITVTELYTDPPRQGQASITIVPRCGELAADIALCRCECSANYTLGKCTVTSPAPGDGQPL